MLRRKEAELEEAQRLAHLGSWQWDVAAGTFNWSDELYRIHGLDPKSPPPSYSELSNLFTPESWERLSLALKGGVRTGLIPDLELEIVRPDGGHRWIAARGEAVRDASSRVVYLRGAVQDITERKIAQLAPQESEARERLKSKELEQEKPLMDAILDTVPGILFLFDEQGKPIRWNRQSEEITGYSAEEIVHLNVLDFYSEDSKPVVAQEFRRGTNEGHAKFEANLRLKNGAEIPFYFTSARLMIGGKRHLVGVGIDMRARIQAETELKKLSQRLITAQEEERSRLARGLHDDTSQRLALLAIQLEQLGQNLPQDEAEITASLLDLHQQISDLATDVHRLSRRLHPSILDRVGLAPALRSLCDGVGRQSKIAVTFKSKDVPGRIPEDVSLCLFRVTEEAITNALKHSEASEIRVELAGDSGQIRLRISDSGRGFELDKAEKGGGLGLLSMKERLRLVHGKLLIESALNKGTQSEARIPIATAQHAEASLF